MKLFSRIKKNNKGFSLVELIIVIAIMAVLVGVLAPQYIRYVEKSRLAADATTIDEMVSALQVCAASSVLSNTSTKYTISFTNGTADLTTDATDLNAIGFNTIVDTSKTYSLKSSAYISAAPKIELAYDSSSSMWKVTVVSTVQDVTLPTSIN